MPSDSFAKKNHFPSFKVVDSSSREIYIELTSADSFFIKFKDNMNIINLVNFKVSE